jgi:hypothetical protein
MFSLLTSNLQRMVLHHGFIKTVALSAVNGLQRMSLIVVSMCKLCLLTYPYLVLNTAI